MITLKRIPFRFLLVMMGYLILSGCTPKPSYNETITFDKGSWNRFRYLNYEFTVENPDNTYDLSVVITYNDYINIDMLPVNVVMVLPGGEERIKDYNIYLKERNGTMKGEKKEGNYELTLVIRENLQFAEKGPVKIEIENLNSKVETPGILSFGILLEKSKSDQ